MIVDIMIAALALVCARAAYRAGYTKGHAEGFAESVKDAEALRRAVASMPPRH